MRSSLFISAATALLVAGVSLAGPSARAANVLVSQVLGPGADAFFTGIDDTGCVVSNATLMVNEAKVVSPPTGVSARSNVFLFITAHSRCTGALLLLADGYDTPSNDIAFTIDERLGSARLAAIVPVIDRVSNSTLLVFVDTSWIAAGRLDVGNRHVHVQFERCVTNFHAVGKSRSAQASGTMIIGGFNHTPMPSTSAQLRNDMSGFVRVECE